MTSRVLIVGDRSFLGKRLAEILAPDYQVITAGRSSSADVVFDLENPKLPVAPPVDVAVICATSFLGEDPEGMITNETVNAVGPLRAAALARASGCGHIIYTSTISSLEGQAASSYGLSKRHGQENLALFCASHGIVFTALLFTHLYDETGEGRHHQPFLYAVMRSARQGCDITLHGTADPLRNYLFVADAAEVIKETIRAELEGVFPCLHPRSYRVSEIANLALETYGRGGRVVWDPAKPDIAPTPIVEDDRLYQELGFHPRVDLRMGMEWIRDHTTDE